MKPFWVREYVIAFNLRLTMDCGLKLTLMLSMLSGELEIDVDANWNFESVNEGFTLT